MKVVVVWTLRLLEVGVRAVRGGSCRLPKTFSICWFCSTLGQLEVTLDPRGLYPYEPPKTLLYRSGGAAQLGFPAIAALTAAIWRRCAQTSV